MVSDSDTSPSAEDDSQASPAGSPQIPEDGSSAIGSEPVSAIPSENANTETDELPDWEELTPELMEDECLRGDAMLRGAVLLLALLLGWTYITETSVLVSIRTGEFIAGQSWLPPRTDPFSSSAAGRTWVNLGWLMDLKLGLAHRWLGMGWLSVMSALTAAVSFGFVTRVRLPSVATWWTSVCYAITLVAIFPVLQPGGMSITLLGLAVLCWVLFRWSLNPETPLLRILPILFLVWTNADDRAWLGLLLLITFALGRHFATGDEPPARRKKIWVVVGVSAAVAVLLNPWPGRLLTAGWTQYQAGLEVAAYGGISEFLGAAAFSLVHRLFWERLDPFAVAALLLIVVSLITQLLNRKRLHPGWGAAWLVSNLLGLLIPGLWPYVAVMNGVVASLAGQDWYRSHFSMAYTIDTWSVLTARGGRAATVLGFFVLAYVSINGALMGAGGRRIGMGLDPRWENRIESLGRYVVNNAYTDRIVPMMPDQGDLLLWLGKKPFIDSRLPLYLGGDRNLLKLHRDLRQGIFVDRRSEDAEKRTRFWKETLDEFETYDVITRLWGDTPAYDLLFTLMIHPDWVMTGFGAAAANFTRSDIADEALEAHNLKHRQTRFVERAFVKSDEPPVLLLPTWPQSLSAYDRWLIQKIPHSSNAAQVARHYDEIRNRLAPFTTPQQAAALAHLSIRLSRRALVNHPNDPLPYRVLSNAYSQLNFVEQQVSIATGGVMTLALRGGQALATAFHAAQAGGDEPDDLFRLLQLLLRQEKIDVALDVLERLDSALDRSPLLEISADELLNPEIRIELQSHVESVRQRLQEAREQGASGPGLAMVALEGRCPRIALSILEEDLTLVATEPGVQLLYGTLLLDNGRTEEAWEQLEGMEQRLPKSNVSPQMTNFMSQWRSMAAMASLAAAEAERPLQLWADDVQAMTHATLSALLSQPFAATMIDVQHDLWPATSVSLAVTAELQFPERWAQRMLEQALVQIEVGRLTEARKLLEQILEHHPEFSQRTIAVFYLSLLTGKEFEVTPPSNWIPIWEGMFAPDE